MKKLKRGDVFEILETFKFSNHLARSKQFVIVTGTGACWVKFKISNKPTYEFCLNTKRFKTLIESKKIKKVGENVIYLPIRRYEVELQRKV